MTTNADFDRWIPRYGAIGTLYYESGSTFDCVDHCLFLTPAMGDMLLLEAMVEFQGPDAAQTVLGTLSGGMEGFVYGPASGQALFGSAQCYLSGLTPENRFSAHIKPEQAVLLRAGPPGQLGEGLWFQSPELDTDATPTGQVRVYVTARRLRGRG